MGVRLKLLLRVFAVGSSLLLVAALVAYRAGAAGRSRQAESGAVVAAPSPTTEPAAQSPIDPPPRPTATVSPEDKVIFGGSKSLVLDPIPLRATLPLDK